MNVLQAGYTLVEMIVVVLIVSVLAAAVMLSTGSTSDRAAMTQSDQLRRDFAHAQSLALSWGVPLRFTTASDGLGYTFSCRGTAIATPCTILGATPVDPATGKDFSRIKHVPAEPDDWPDGVTIAGVNSSLDFDSLGRPIVGTGLLAIVSSYTISSINKSITVTVQPITGFAAAN